MKQHNSIIQEAHDLLVRNLLRDTKKENLTNHQRAVLLSSYCETNGVSRRQLAKQLNVPKSTLDDWVRWKEVTPQLEQRLITQGYTRTAMYRILRNPRLRTEMQQAEGIDPVAKLMCERLTHITEEVRGLTMHAPKVHDATVKTLVDDLVKQLNYLSFRLSQQTQTPKPNIEQDNGDEWDDVI